MQAQTDLYGFNGNVLVAQNGKVLYKKSFGYADYNAKSKLDSNSIFDCGSIAKEFTAMGVLLLKDKGLISYSDTLRKFFPELPYNNVTIQQLLILNRYQDVVIYPYLYHKFQVWRYSN